jgi:UDP-2,4-diacetamido-2,4,6-trideoxy-beta-L-altropyranose hydrolase
MVTAERKVLFRVDAGPHIGLGHLQRCLSLGSAFCHFEAGCLFLTNEERTILDRVKRFGFDGYALGAVGSWTDDDLSQTLAIAASHRCMAIVVDSDYEGADYLGKLRDAGFFVCAIEDIAPHPFPCQLVVNGDAHARQLPYHSSSGDTLFLLGPEYSILRREFWERPSRMVRDVVQNILVTLGGADPHNLMPRILGLLDELLGTFTITAIIGPFFDNLVEVQTIAACTKHLVKLVFSPESVRDLMLEADLAVSAGGQTLYELACVGCPTIAVRMASNQDGQLQVFAVSGFVRVAGRADDSGIVTAIGDTLLSLLSDSKARAAMSGAGQRLIDGQGALRVAQAILAETAACKTDFKWEGQKSQYG